MRAALIVVGSELRAYEQAETLSDYLRKVAGIRHTSICPGWNRNEDSLKGVFVYHATKAARQPFLLAYIGHGYKDREGVTGWSYGYESGEKDLRIPYKTLVGWIKEYREGPTLVLNDCCYSGSFLPIATPRNLRKRIGVIASTIRVGYSYGSLTQSVIDTWMDGKTYAPRTYPGTHDRYEVREMRDGPELDAHFLPCPEKLKIIEQEARANEAVH